MTHLRSAALAVVVLTTVAGCSRGHEGRGSSGGNHTDRAFVAEMIPHHRSAIEMARIARRRGGSQFVKDLAADIERTQSTEIATMQRADGRLDVAGIKPAKLDGHERGVHEDPALLRTARPFDRAFIDMMVAHHQGSIRAAQMAINYGSDPELNALAQHIVKTQAREIEAMNAHRRAAFGKPSPAGGIPADGH